MITDTKTVTPILEIQDAAVRSVPTLAAARQVSIFEQSVKAMLSRSDANMDTLLQYMQMHERWEEREADKAFTEAIASFKENAPEILKTKFVEFETQKGKTSYWHEELGEICANIVKGLAAVGISHRWKPHTADGKFGISCALTHRMGHQQDDGPLWSSADTSGGKNSIQAMASTMKYLERYSLLMAVGLASRDMLDDDGRGHQDAVPVSDWVDAYLEAINEAAALSDLVAAWKTAAGACRRKQDRKAFGELRDAVSARVTALEITAEQWEAATAEKVA
jgi:hypothetical protein